MPTVDGYSKDDVCQCLTGAIMRISKADPLGVVGLLEEAATMLQKMAAQQGQSLQLAPSSYSQDKHRQKHIERLVEPGRVGNRAQVAKRITWAIRNVESDHWQTAIHFMYDALHMVKRNAEAQSKKAAI